MIHRLLLSIAIVTGFGSLSVVAADEAPYWLEPMREVHARFDGRPGTFAHFGDSITVTLAFWTPLLYARKNASPELEEAFASAASYLQPECWRDWKGPRYGNDGGQTVRWAAEHIGTWLEDLDPEVALILFGTNDLHTLELDEYRRTLRNVVKRALENGTVVILSTPPPRSGFVEEAAAFADAVREIAKELRVPLSDFHREILARRPDDWDGSLAKFAGREGYDVPALISRDGVHPSHPTEYRDDYSEEALASCGYSLRNAVVLRDYVRVIEALRGLPALDPPSEPFFPKAPRFEASGSPKFTVRTVDELFGALEKAEKGDTIVIADGRYDLPRRAEIRTDGVTLRGASGHRERVVLDGGKHDLGELLAVHAASDVTIADLTVQNVRWNGIKIDSETSVHRLTIRNVVLHNIWQRAVKGVRVPEERRTDSPRDGRVEYSLFYNDRAKTLEQDPADSPSTFGGNYIGGIDVMYAKGWTVSDNVFTGIHGHTREARGAVFIWHESEDCVVERNIIIDCDSGICLGNSSRDFDSEIHATRCVVRNNFLTRVPENGILADYTKDCRILHNTVHDPQSRLGRLIRIVHDNEGLAVANNLLSGPPVRIESSSTIEMQGNVTGERAAIFADAAAGDLHLVAEDAAVIDAAVPLENVEADLDREPRGERPDIGADEFQPEDEAETATERER